MASFRASRTKRRPILPGVSNCQDQKIFMRKPQSPIRPLLVEASCYGGPLLADDLAVGRQSFWQWALSGERISNTAPNKVPENISWKLGTKPRRCRGLEKNSAIENAIAGTALYKVQRCLPKQRP